MKKLGLFVALLLLSVGGGLAFTWREFTRLPDWYGTTPTPEEPQNILTPEAFDDPGELAILEQQLKDKWVRSQSSPPSQLSDSNPFKSIQPPSNSRASSPAPETRELATSPRREIVTTPETQTTSTQSTNESPVPETSELVSSKSLTLNEQDLNELIVVAANKSSRSQPFLEGVKGIKTEITRNNIQSEVIINLAQVNRAKLQPAQLKILEDLTNTLPSLAQNDLLLTIQGKPQVTQGELQLEPNIKVGIGGLKTTLGELAKRFDIPLPQEPINLNLGEVSIQDLEYREDALVITTN